MKPEQLEIERLRREIVKLKAERDILKKGARLAEELLGRLRVWPCASGANP